MNRCLSAIGLLLVLSVPASAQAPLRVRMLQAEDARGTGPGGVAALDEGLRSRDPQVRRQAVRALGRIERTDLIAKVLPVADDPDPLVQQQAIDALGQLAHTAAAVAEVQALLLSMEARVSSQTWPVLAATLGRLPYQDIEQVRRAEARLAAALPNGSDRSRGAGGMLGATRGLEALVRLSRKIAPLTTATVDGLRAAATSKANGADGATLVRVRRLVWLTLGTLGSVDDGLVEAGLADADEEVRRLATATLGSEATFERRPALLQTALKDANPRVRYEALRVWGRQMQKTSCAPIQAALRDGDAHVMLLAIDLLGAGCPEVRRGGSLDPPEPLPSSALQSIAMVLTGQPGGWHGPAHAIVSLARVAPGEARPLLSKFATHQIWQVRMYAARAAGALGAVDELRALAGDPHDNVREAAIGALMEQKRPEVVGAAIEALSRRDYQLVMSAARALAATPADQRDRAVTALLAALDRVTAEKRDTSRDPRMAILERLQELGGKAHTSRLEPYLRDFDPRVAAKAAELLAAWTGVTRVADPQPLPHPPIDAALLDELARTTLRVTIAGKGRFTLRLLADESPLSLLRVVARARAGYYNGLTFHRVAANFVIQGGSPGANEYMGDGPYMRDEVGLLSHTRATVGISTRGRDTGDAQIFVNLIDSPRLDHTYTVLADVIDGMDIVDRVLEGDVIEAVSSQLSAVGMPGADSR
jgi:cyclophilin family peptidyl-prolyl cis-trans isomerase/HEAT repeat protein